jgi:2-C-methyl-D-erythritol 4-phosphate cytidylyltransferase
VAKGVEGLKAESGDLVLVHDGARPLVTQDLIERIIDAARETGAAVPAIPLDDTIKEAEKDRVVRTLDRSRLFRIQTPQGFALGLLQRALERAQAEGAEGTDEASLVERLGLPVALVPGDPRNLKITSPLDLTMAEAFLGH